MLCVWHDISVRQHFKVNIELPAKSTHWCDMTERLLETRIKQTKMYCFLYSYIIKLARKTCGSSSNVSEWKIIDCKDT